MNCKVLKIIQKIWIHRDKKQGFHASLTTRKVVVVVVRLFLHILFAVACRIYLKTPARRVF
jgi:hypothetical protein